jgi:enamine deaminase RidA (YjgF/YER057c/UK114 family)
MSPVSHLNPESLPHNPAFTHAVRVDPPASTIYVGGQNGVGADGAIVEGGMGAQSAQAFANLETVLAAAGASLEHVVKWTMFCVAGHPLEEGVAAFAEAWGRRPDPPAISVVVVAGLANPAFLVEIEAVAVLPSV